LQTNTSLTAQMNKMRNSVCVPTLENAIIMKQMFVGMATPARTQSSTRQSSPPDAVVC
jgi:hypothetical protein